MKTTARNRGSNVAEKRSSPTGFRKLDSKKPSGTNGDATDLHGSSVTPVYGENSVEDDEGVLQRDEVRPSKQETKRGLFMKNPGSRVVPYPEDDSEATVAISNMPADICRHHKDFEDLAQIRKQLVQIENQQSSLMDVLQVILGSIAHLLVTCLYLMESFFTAHTQEIFDFIDSIYPYLSFFVH